MKFYTTTTYNPSAYYYKDKIVRVAYTTIPTRVPMFKIGDKVKITSPYFKNKTGEIISTWKNQTLLTGTYEVSYYEDERLDGVAIISEERLELINPTIVELL